MRSRRVTQPVSSEIGLVAIDVDGTLLRSDKSLTRVSAEAIAEATEAGVHVVIASARPPRSVREIYHALGLDTLAIHYNGALIHDLPRGKHVYHQPIDVGLAKRIVKVARRVDRNVSVSAEILDKWYTDFVDPELPTETSKIFRPDMVGPLESFMYVPVTKLMLLAPPQRLQKVTDMIRRRFAGQVTVIVSDPHMIQIVHPEVDKAHALQRIAQQYGVMQCNVMAIGDAPNDVGMLRWAGLGVAMENAWPIVHTAADVIVPSNDDNGVAYAIRKYVLKPRRKAAAK